MSFETFWTIFTSIGFVVIGVFIVLIIIGYFRRKKYNEKRREEYNELYYGQHDEVEPPLSFDEKLALMKRTDVELFKLIGGQERLYDPEAIAAKEILRKRRIWDEYKSKTDAELMGIINDSSTVSQPEGTYMRDVASMELFTRRSPLFMETMTKQTADELKKISDNPSDYYDGYIIAAREILKNK